MKDKNNNKPIASNETPTPEVKPINTTNNKVEENKPAPKKPGMSKLRKRLILTLSISFVAMIATLIVDNSGGGGGDNVILIIVFVLATLALTASVVLSVLIYKREPDHKKFPLISLIISSILLGIFAIVGIIFLVSLVF